MMLVRRSIQDALGDAGDVIPQWLPLILLVPDIGALEQRHHQALRLHEYHLRRTNLSLHGISPLCSDGG